MASKQATFAESKARLAALKAEHAKCAANKQQADMLKVKASAKQKQLAEVQKTLGVFKEQESKLLLAYRASEKEAEVATKQTAESMAQLSANSAKLQGLKEQLAAHEATYSQADQEQDRHLQVKAQLEVEIQRARQLKAEVT